jgi:LysR family transcriptional regulator, glycine cleavage system transcriptional activator
VSLHCARALVDFEADKIDMAIRYGSGAWPNCRAELLAREAMQVVCAPGRVAELGQPPAPSRLLDARLLHGDNPETWADWFKAAGIAGGPARPGPTINHENALLEATASGQGFALARSLLARGDIATGRLVAPFALALRARFAYWIVTPKGRPDRPAVATMRDFIRELMSRDKLALGEIILE